MKQPLFQYTRLEEFEKHWKPQIREWHTPFEKYRFEKAFFFSLQWIRREIRLIPGRPDFVIMTGASIFHAIRKLKDSTQPTDTETTFSFEPGFLIELDEDLPNDGFMFFTRQNMSGLDAIDIRSHKTALTEWKRTA